MYYTTKKLIAAILMTGTISLMGCADINNPTSVFNTGAEVASTEEATTESAYDTFTAENDCTAFGSMSDGVIIIGRYSCQLGSSTIKDMISEGWTLENNDIDDMLSAQSANEYMMSKDDSLVIVTVQNNYNNALKAAVLPIVGVYEQSDTSNGLVTINDMPVLNMYEPNFKFAYGDANISYKVKRSTMGADYYSMGDYTFGIFYDVDGIITELMFSK